MISPYFLTDFLSQVINPNSKSRRRFARFLIQGRPKNASWALGRHDDTWHKTCVPASCRLYAWYAIYAWNPSYRSFSIPFFRRVAHCVSHFFVANFVSQLLPHLVSRFVSHFVTHCPVSRDVVSQLVPLLSLTLSPTVFLIFCPLCFRVCLLICFTLCLALCPPPWLPLCLLLYLPPFTPLSPTWHHLSFPLRLPFCLPLYSSLSQTVCPAASPTLLVTMSHAENQNVTQTWTRPANLLTVILTWNLKPDCWVNQNGDVFFPQRLFHPFYLSAASHTCIHIHARTYAYI